jgi:hypothetical protein
MKPSRLAAMWLLLFLALSDQGAGLSPDPLDLDP